MRLIIILILSTITNASFGTEYIYKCKVNEISEVSEYESENFDVSNGPVDGDIYSIKIHDNKLNFTNTSNNASITMGYDKLSGTYKGTWFTFSLNKIDKAFVFSVNKPNYSVDYIGVCQ